VSVAVARAPAPGGFADVVGLACARAGAQVIDWPLTGGEPAEFPAPAPAADVLVTDAAGLYAHARATQADGLAALRACLDSTWQATRAVLGAPAEGGRPLGRRSAISLAPPAGDDPYAEAARAALENLARTLSIEWARQAITTVAIAPGPRTLAADIGALAAYLASPAGAYFSGCQLDLRGPCPTAPTAAGPGGRSPVGSDR
jgi:NAD(P)-dependent dehydrogenase (short-subunit alcohol dehydrogenase family)